MVGKFQQTRPYELNRRSPTQIWLKCICLVDTSKIIHGLLRCDSKNPWSRPLFCTRALRTLIYSQILESNILEVNYNYSLEIGTQGYLDPGWQNMSLELVEVDCLLISELLASKICICSWAEIKKFTFQGSCNTQMSLSLIPRLWQDNKLCSFFKHL